MTGRVRELTVTCGLDFRLILIYVITSSLGQDASRHRSSPGVSAPDLPAGDGRRPAPLPTDRRAPPPPVLPAHGDDRRTCRHSARSPLLAAQAPLPQPQPGRCRCDTDPQRAAASRDPAGQARRQRQAPGVQGGPGVAALRP